MGTKRTRDRQASLWAATGDLPRRAGHPFYERLNRVLDDAPPDHSTVSRTRRLLENVVEKLRDVGTGNGIVGLQSMPYLVLDEMVRLTNGGAGDTRKELLEVILYSDDGKKELNYIPISA